MQTFSDFLKQDENASRYLLESSSYRVFLRRFFELKKKLNPNYSFTLFAKSAGVARSLPRDIIESDKRLTEKSLPKFLKAMDLPNLIEEVFVKLMELESNPKLRDYIKRLGQIYLEGQFHHSYTDLNFQNPLIPFIYAASGKIDQGETLETIAKRTGLTTEIIKAALPTFQALGLGILNPLNDKLVPSVAQVHVETKSDENHFKDFYLFCQNLQKEILLNQEKSPETLFYNEIFSLDRDDLPKLRELLKSQLKSFVIKSEKANGDSVVILNLGFTRQKF